MNRRKGEAARSASVAACPCDFSRCLIATKMIREKLLRDPVHDLIAFDLSRAEDRLLLELIDSPEIQRLRRVKQLGMAHMAYQGAEHSRFSHSIGVLHLVRRMLAQVERQATVPTEWRIATMAAGLLHDVGHGPFSHVMEKFFREDHETWSERVILSGQTDVNRVLRQFDPKLPSLVTSVIAGKSEPKWLSSLISSQMDADRFDYLLRDSHMTGVKYGVFDLERLILLLRVHDDNERIVIASKGLLPVEKYLQSRYHMYRQVYYHKTVTSAEAMLMAVLDRARDLAREHHTIPCVDGGTPLFKVLSGDSLELGDYLALDDSILLSAMNLWTRCDDAVLRDISWRLLNRRLFKVMEVPQFDDRQGDYFADQKRKAVEELLSNHGLDARYYLRFSKSADHPYRPFSPAAAGSTIWIQDDANGGELKDVKDVSPTIKAFTESQYTIYRAFFPDSAGGVDIRARINRMLGET
ncbi:HD domain-containing protein [Candidatus Sumerlaeota bacterium]|nr:HD domain-containing protein [Candidatus Sumerlaeota bacterium]